MKGFAVAACCLHMLTGCSSHPLEDGSSSGSPSTLNESCSKTGDCASDLRCIAQTCVPDLPAGFCAQYDALCPGDLSSVQECELECEEKGTNAGSDDCWFPACGAEVGKCDNQADGDAAILACADAHGWR
jgi:hypothetical protein